MKLIMEGWRKHLSEEKHRTQILAYLEENNIALTEEELEEAMPKWLKKLGAGAALGATLMGGAPSPAQAADADPVTQTQDAQAETKVIFNLTKQIDSIRRIDLAKTSLMRQAQNEGAQKLSTTPDNVKIKVLDTQMTDDGALVMQFQASLR